MNCSPSQCLDNLFASTAVARYAVTRLEEVDDAAHELYRQRISKSYHAGMDYLERYEEVRKAPALLLEGAQSIICCAIPYLSPHLLPPRKSKIAAYAMGTDYHEIVRAELEDVACHLRETFGGNTRVCVDTAPLRERYWACRAGLGFIGLNNHLIIPGLGSCFFLGEILTTAVLPASPALPIHTRCNGCGECVKHCPTGALKPDGTVDARLCLSYLTIEHRGDFPEGTELYGHLYGCDECGAACPHNKTSHSVPVHPALLPRPALLSLTVEEAARMSQDQFSTLFTHSAIKRTKLAGLQRNAISILTSRRARTEKK